MLCGMTEMATTSRTGGWTPDDSKFGARLALVRQRMAWGNVKEAATACGLPAESWRRWERDGILPRNVVEICAIIADRTGADYGWLLAGPKLTSYGRTPEPPVAGIKPWKSRLAERTGPNGHPKRTSPDPATRRPARV